MARPKGPVPEHGTRQRYQLRGAGCRCDECKAANARYQNGHRHAAARAAWWRNAVASSAAGRTVTWEQLPLPAELVPRERSSVA